MDKQTAYNERIITKSPNRICLHDSKVTGAHLDNGKLKLYFDEGLLSSDGTRSEKAAIIIKAHSSDDYCFERKKDHSIFHRYFGVVTYSSFKYFEKLIKKNQVFVNDEFYGEICVMTFWVLHKKEEIKLEWSRIDDIDVLYY